MKSIFTLFLFLSISFYCYAQNFSSQDPAYVNNVKAGEQALLNESYDSCLIYYQEAFKVKQTSFLSTLRGAACAYSAENKAILKQYLDKAFELSWDGTHGIFNSYPEFNYLKDTPFEEMINERYKKAAKASGLDLDLMNELAEIRGTDQEHRAKMGPISEKYGWQSPQMDSLWTLQNAVDEKNQKRIIEIIEDIGYPGKTLVGNQQASTAFLVIQHADLEIQEKYLKTITDAADAGEVAWRSVALLVDRVRMRNGEKQIYGSQVSRDQETGEHYFAPIENPFKVDSIRATVGLGSIQQYGDNWDIKWDPKKHIERSQKE